MPFPNAYIRIQKCSLTQRQKEERELTLELRREKITMFQHKVNTVEELSKLNTTMPQYLLDIAFTKLNFTPKEDRTITMIGDIESIIRTKPSNREIICPLCKRYSFSDSETVIMRFFDAKSFAAHIQIHRNKHMTIQYYPNGNIYNDRNCNCFSCWKARIERNIKYRNEHLKWKLIQKMKEKYSEDKQDEIPESVFDN